MRLFQNCGLYPSYRPRLKDLQRGCETFAQSLRVFLDDRFGASHILLPVYENTEEVFFTNADDELTQSLWAREHGMRDDASPGSILLAQIEEHRTEVFYNSDPVRYGDDFLARLPGCVKLTVAWRAAPSSGGRFLKHDMILNNFPSLLEGYRKQGVRAEYFAPSHDPVMDAYAANSERPIDILFVGTYSRYHRNRAALLEAIAALHDEMQVVMHLDKSRLTRLAETPVGWIGPLASHRRAPSIQAVSQSPVFGRDLLQAIGSAKIVINGAIDMAGGDRGNMRVWEALGCGALMLSDEGLYPDGLNAGEHFITYASSTDAVAKVRALIRDPVRAKEIARNGHALISTRYSKQAQWDRFKELVA